MKLFKYKIILLFLLLELINGGNHSFSAQSVDTSQLNTSLDKDVLNKRVKELNYDKVITRYKFREFKRNENKKPLSEPKPITGLLEMILKVLTYGLVAFVIIFIIYYLYKDYNFKKLKDSIHFDINENFEVEDIESLSLDPMLENALLQGNYRFSIRLKFLKILQVLQDKKLIKWKKDKTNRTYILEIKEVYKNDFVHIISIFDKVWYGNIAINKTQFDKVAIKFDNFLNQFVK